MNISYDIFDLVDFPVVITDKNFIIIYKNNIACEYFGKLRKRSKITRYLADSTKNTDFSVISEAEFETGTLIKRALVFSKNDFIAFFFLSAMQFDGYIAVSEHIREKFAGESFRALGLKLYCAKINSQTREFCQANICLTHFLFVLFRLIYLGFKFSADGNLEISIDYLHTNHADICVSARTALKNDSIRGKSFSSVLKMLPEFPFEFDILEKCQLFEQNSLSYKLENSILKLHFKVKCDTGETLSVRSESTLKRKKRISKAVSVFLCKTKNLLSKN